MKKFTLLIVLFFELVVLAQSSVFTVNCGNDTIYCKDLFGEPKSYLASNITLQNGVPPYNYLWKCKYKVVNTNYSADDFLNDINVANPYFIDYPIDDDPLNLILQVTDSMNTVAFDTIQVRFSRFAYSLEIYKLYVNKGDSVQILGSPFVGAAIAPLTYHWQPELYLDNPNIFNPWCKPESDIIYSQIAVDSVGCLSLPNAIFEVYVVSTGFNTGTSNESSIFQSGTSLNFPNPNSENVSFKVYSLNGKLLVKDETFDQSYNLDFLAKNQIYIVSIELEDLHYQLKIKL